MQLKLSFLCLLLRDSSGIVKDFQELSLEKFGLDNVDTNKNFKLSGTVSYG